MASLSSLIPTIFRKAWDRYGRPVMATVPPISDWSLPSGFGYNPTTDRIEDSSGLHLSNWVIYSVVDYIYIVPATPSADLQIAIAAGIVPSGTVEAGILGNDVETVRAAFAVQIRDQWYDVLDIQENPLGTSSSWARVRLTRRS